MGKVNMQKLHQDYEHFEEADYNLPRSWWKGEMINFITHTS